MTDFQHPISKTISVIMVLVSKFYIFLGLCLSPTVQGALVQVTDFGSNPAGLEMYIDLPENVTAKAPVILAVSSSSPWCSQRFINDRIIRLSFMVVADQRRDTMGRTILQLWANPEVPSWSTHPPQTAHIAGTPGHRKV